MNLIKNALLIAATVAIGACKTTSTTNEFASKTTFYKDKTVMVDANGFARLANEKRVVIADTKYGRVLSLAEASELSDLIGAESVSYNIDDNVDKRNPYSEFYKNIPNFLMLEKNSYSGRDDWTRESGAERNASIEYWLMGEVLRMVKDDRSLIEWRPDLVGGKKVDSVDPDIFVYGESQSDMIGMIEYALKAGFNITQAENLAATCYGDKFFFFKLSSGLSEKEKNEVKEKRRNMPNRERSGKVPRDFSGCDHAREMLTKNNVSIFEGHRKFETKQVRNKTIKVVDMTDPEFSIEFWQHLMSDGLYASNSLVKKKGIFTGLASPEVGNVFLGLYKNNNGSNAALFNDPYAYSHQQEITAGHIAYQWLGDQKFINNFNDQNLNKKWLGLKSETLAMGGDVVRGLITCNMDSSLVNMQVNGNYFNRYYNCSMGVDSNVRVNAKANLSSFKPHQGTGPHISQLKYTAYIDFDKQVVSDERTMKNDCVDAIYPAGCRTEAKTNLSEVIETRIISTVNPNTIIALTRFNKQGEAEGVVYYFGTKFVINLEKIRDWYLNRSN